MRDTFVLDACALIAMLANEPGAENVRKIILDAIHRSVYVKINQINLLEVYYKICNVYDQDVANKIIAKIKKLPIEIIIGLKEKTFNEAGRIKSKYKVPLGDSIAVAECIIGNSILVTSDHNDFEKIEKNENLTINWFR
ncbi:MAG: PIN domain-containing protein [Chitinispirillales bacterium]|nr:PIN domain-containing protein [Chitinispirillales bacterium]